eukprot:5739997-Pleurochrysis_carterae.AAC.1
MQEYTRLFATPDTANNRFIHDARACAQTKADPAVSSDDEREDGDAMRDSIRDTMGYTHPTANCARQNAYCRTFLHCGIIC